MIILPNEMKSAKRILSGRKWKEKHLIDIIEILRRHFCLAATSFIPGEILHE